MLRLSLLRHAKSSGDDPELDDHERQLTKRGTKAASRIGRYIAKHSLKPDLILCSGAIRTRATLALVIAALDQPPPATVITERLYLAGPDHILGIIAEEAGQTPHVMVIGHNPGMHALALSLPAKAKQADLRRLALKYPTAALAHIVFDAESWAGIRPATGHLKCFVMPRELDG